jgi:hypothetical protein
VPGFHFSSVLANDIFLPALTRPDPRDYADRKKKEQKRDNTKHMGSERSVVKDDRKCEGCSETLHISAIEFLRHKIACCK